MNGGLRAMPSNWHSIHKNDLARAMVAQRSRHSSRLLKATLQGADRDGPKVQSLADLRVFLVPRACDVTIPVAAAEAKAMYSAIVLGATGNVGGRIVQLLIKNRLCKRVVV